MPLNSDSDDDLFFQAGRRMPTSVYSVTREAEASSDEEDKPIFETPAKRPRGRPKKISTPVRILPKEKKQKSSVFEISDDDDSVVAVPQQELDERDRTVNSTLEDARAVLAQGDEDILAKEAEEEINRERELREREEELKRCAAEEELQRKEAEAERARKEKATLEQREAAVARGETPKQDVDAIQFQVRMDDARKVRMRIRRTDPVLKMLYAFCKKFGLLVADVIMTVDGEEVGETDTSESLDCDDGMQIDIAMRKR